jgi:sugar lactone lactonase YvrE
MSSSANPEASAANPVASAANGVSLTGVLHGGQAPISGSALTLYAAGLPATAAPNMLGTSTTDANGSFNIPYICPKVSTLVYVVAAGGNSGGGVNSAIKLMAALGPCDSLPSSIVINELTTVAAVYALNAFSNIAPSGTGLGGCVDCVPVVQADMTQLHGNSPAINNAFKTAALLADVTTGQPAQSLPPAASCTVAGAPVNCSALRKFTALGNVLGSCVNSAGASSAQCTALFNCAVPNATEMSAAALDCTVPAGSNVSTDTLQATLSIARNQGVVGLPVLSALAGRTVLFSPGSLELGNDATIAISFTGGGINGPVGIAIDSAGDVWTANYASNVGDSISELSAIGLPLSPAAGFTGGGLGTPVGIAIDSAGNVWVANRFGPGGLGGVSEFNTSGTPLSGSAGFTGAWANNPFAIAIDANGNIWTVNADGNGNLNELSPQGTILSGNGFTGGGLANNHFGIAVDAAGNVWTTNDPNGISELTSGGVPVSPAAGFVGGGLNAPVGIAIDSGGNVWIANSGNNSVSEFSSSGQPFSLTTGFTGGGLNAPVAIAIDGVDHIWVTNPGNGSVTELNSSGATLSPFGFKGIGAAGSTALLDRPQGIAIDAAGDVWVSNSGNNTVTEFIGAAAPSVTPLVAQIAKPAAALVSIAVTPTAATITDGNTQQFTATGTYADASVRNLSASATWSSSNTTFATIAAGGLATCVAPGAVDITASMTQDGTIITGTATQALTCSAPIVSSGPACNTAPANPGGAQPYDNQSYCVSFSGLTDINYQFAGTLTFTTPSTPGAVTGCSYWSSGTLSGAGPYSTAQTPCSGVINASAGAPTLNLLDAFGNSFSLSFSGGAVSGSYSLGDFGPSVAAGGNAVGQISATSPTAATAAARLHQQR